MKKLFLFFIFQEARCFLFLASECFPKQQHIANPRPMRWATTTTLPFVDPSLRIARRSGTRDSGETSYARI